MHYFFAALACVPGMVFGAPGIWQPTKDTGSSLSGSGGQPDSAALRDDHSAARPDSATIESLDKIVVTADRRQRMMDASQSFSIVEAGEWAGTAKNVADALGELAGVQTRRWGGAGSYQTVSIRGIQGSEVLVLCDGIPLNSALGGAVDLGKFAPSRVREIEVYKGLTPGRFGGNSIGGVINLKTKAVQDGHSAEAEIAAGSYGYRNYSVSFAPPGTGKFSTQGGFSVTRSENDYPYLDRNNTIYGSLIDPALDDTVRRVKNDRFRMEEFRQHFEYGIAPGRRLVTGFSVSALEKRLPAPEGRVNKTARYGARYFDVSITLPDDAGDRMLSVVPLVTYRTTRHTTIATRDDQGFGASHGGGFDRFEYRLGEQALIAQVAAAVVPVKTIVISPSCIVNLQDGKPSAVRDDRAYGDWHSREASATLALDIEATINRMGVRAGGSVRGAYCETEGGYDIYSAWDIPPSDTTTAVWGAGAGVSFRPAERVALYGNAGRYSNSPTLRERFGGRGAQMPNPELDPETGVSCEAGVKYHAGGVYCDIAGFINRSKNTIIIINDGYQAKPKNCGGARVFGMELSGEATIARFARLELNVTLQKTENLTVDFNWYGRRLPEEPGCTVRGGIEIHPVRQVLLRYAPVFESYYYHLPANLDDSRVPAVTGVSEPAYGRLTHDIVLTIVVKNRVRFVLSGTDLTASILPVYPAATAESGYSWTLYPANQWGIACSFSL
jgi:iron complex outermembrane receptor protein